MNYLTKKRRKSSYEIRSKLRTVRVEHGMTIQDVADRTGYSYSTIVKAEEGLINRRKPNDSRTVMFWKTMSDYFDIPVEDLKE